MLYIYACISMYFIIHAAIHIIIIAMKIYQRYLNFADERKLAKQSNKLHPVCIWYVSLK